MANLAVATLHLRGPPALAFRARMRVEEALRLTAPEGGRLLVLRRLPLGRLPVTGSARLWEARADAALRDAGARAVHALAADAALSEGVWFASVTEARFLLLRELAAGRHPGAWYWRLAVPDWRGATLADWVALLASQALADTAAEVAFAQAVLRLAETGVLPPIAQALAAAPNAPRDVTAPPISPQVAQHPGVVPAREAPLLAQNLLARHSPATRRALLAAIAAAPGGSVARWLARLALVAAAPEAAAQRALLAALAESVLATASGSRAVPGRDATPLLPGTEPLPRHDPPPDMLRDASAPHRVAQQPVEARDNPPAPAAIASLAGDELRSRGAGVLLLVRPLARMGLPAWLDRHPVLAAAGFGRALLRHVAQRQRIAPEDAVFAMLGGEESAMPALDAWRVGLDRWLRRRARRRLADVGCRAGWLSLSGDGIVARFASDSADLRLRRLALDVDPGWVPWLGLSIRYNFRDATP